MPVKSTPLDSDPTPQDGYFFFMIIKHSRNKLDVNWEAVANEMCYANAHTAKTRFRQIKKRLGVEDCATNVDDHGTPTFDGHSQLSVGGAGSLEPIGALSRKRGRDVAFCGDAGEAPTWPYKTRIIPASGGYCQNAADFQDYGYFAGYSYVPLTAQNYHYPDQMDESLIDPVLRTYSQPHVSQPQHYQADGFRPLTIQQMPMPRPLLDIPQQFIFGNHSNTGELNQQYNYPSP